jgi:hypothetical protein
LRLSLGPLDRQRNGTVASLLANQLGKRLPFFEQSLQDHLMRLRLLRCPHFAFEQSGQVSTLLIGADGGVQQIATSGYNSGSDIDCLLAADSGNSRVSVMDRLKVNIKLVV